MVFCPRGTADAPALGLQPPPGTAFALTPGGKHPGLMEARDISFLNPKWFFKTKGSWSST